MKKKRYHLNGNGFKLKRAEIIEYSPWDSDMLTIDVRKLMEMTDKELLRSRGLGPKSLDIIKEVSKALKKLLFETDKK